MGYSKCYTSVLSGSAITLQTDDNVTQVSISVTSGTITVAGNMTFRSAASQAISIASGRTLTLTGTNGNAPIIGLTIDASGGTAEIVFFF